MSRDVAWHGFLLSELEYHSEIHVFFFISLTSLTLVFVCG